MVRMMDGLEGVKLQRRVLADDLAHDDDGLYYGGQRQIDELLRHDDVDAVGSGPLHRADKTARIADDGHDDKADEGAADSQAAQRLDEAVRAVDQAVGAENDAERCADEDDAAGQRVQLVLGHVLLLSEELRVGGRPEV